MSAKRHERTAARTSAVQMLYTSELQGVPPSQLFEQDACLCEGQPLSSYALMLLEGVEQHCAEIDEELALTSKNWTLERMPIVDRAILRLALFEMIYVKDVPISVSINEAVELAKEFGGEEDSPRFVNGVLGRIAVRLEEGDAAAQDADAGAAAPGADAATDDVGDATASGTDANAGAGSGANATAGAGGAEGQA